MIPVARGRRFRLFGLIGYAVAAGGMIWLAMTALFVLRASRAPGVVVKMENSGDSSGWHSTFTFSDAAGAAHTPRTWFLSPSTCPEFAPGDKVTVLYSDASPEDAKIDSFATLWFGPLFFAALGLFLGVVSTLMSAAIRLIARHAQDSPDATPA